MKQVTIPAQWLQELIALCGPEDHELRERVMKSAAPAPVDALATGGQAQAVATLTEEALAEKIRSHGAYGGLAAHLMPFIAQHAAPQAQADAREANVQWWLADIDQYGNPALTDGAHSDRAGADKAAYLINAMGLGQGRKFAVARVELSDPKPSAEDVNHEAIAQNNRAAIAAAKGE